jgi:hypothetical protein
MSFAGSGFVRLLKLTTAGPIGAVGGTTLACVVAVPLRMAIPLPMSAANLPVSLDFAFFSLGGWSPIQSLLRTSMRPRLQKKRC